MKSIFSIYRRGINNFFESLEEPALFTSLLNEFFQEFFKAGCSLALKYNIPMFKAYTELFKALLSRIIPEANTNDADVMMKTDDKNKKEEIKTSSLLSESCILNVAQTYKNIDLERILSVHFRENDIFRIAKEIMIKIMEKYKMPKIDKNAKVQDFVKNIFENASNQDCSKNIFQIASIQDVVKDIIVIIMDVLSITNQEKETSEVQKMAE